ncbi:hypothetical protein BYT27DRAFT_7216956 [Phlegmacium glaucopus]|nr:hypothetical protein BYT27DRAFT_7216956 [Phlegmacium glaucopus]
MTDPSPVAGDLITITDATKPTVSKETVSFTFKGERLDKDKGNWKTWSTEVLDLLDMAGLGSYLTDGAETAPPVLTQLNAHRNWVTNDRSVRGFLRSSISATERDLVSSLPGAKETWHKLESYHLEEGPIKQANQNALTVRIDRDDQMMTKVRGLRDDLRRAFHMQGGINEDTFVTIVALQALSTGLGHSRAIIQRDFRASTPTSPYTVDNLIDFLEQEYQMFLGDKQRIAKSDSAIIFAAQSHQKGKTLILCIICKKHGHSAQWCIRPGGGMAGKTIEESKEAQWRERDSRNPGPRTTTPSPSRVQVSVKGTDGRAYIRYTDPSSLSPADNSMTQVSGEFAGIVSIPPDSLPLDNLEYHGFMATIQEESATMSDNPFSDTEESQTSINWDTYSTQSDTPESVLLHSVENNPFFMDSGASSGISPIKSTRNWWIHH